MTDSIGMEVDDSTVSGSGAITNQTGFWVKPLTVATGTKYAFRADSNPSLFGGQILASDGSSDAMRITAVSTGSGTGTADTRYDNSSGTQMAAIGYAMPGFSSFLSDTTFVYSAAKPICLSANGADCNVTISGSTGGTTVAHGLLANTITDSALATGSIVVGGAAGLLANSHISDAGGQTTSLQPMAVYSPTGGNQISLGATILTNQEFSLLQSGNLASMTSVGGAGVIGTFTFTGYNATGPVTDNYLSLTSSAATFTHAVKPPTFTISGLPSASTAGAGAMVVVTDATTFTPGTCTGGGSDYMIAVSNGSTWSCH